MGKLSLERAVLAPLERLAAALHPYRWHSVFVALLAPTVFFALAHAGEEFWPERPSRVLSFAAPFLANLMIWGWAARFISFQAPFKWRHKNRRNP